MKVSAERKKLILYAASEEQPGPEVALRGRVLDELFVQDVENLEEEIEFEKFLVEIGSRVHFESAVISTESTAGAENEQVSAKQTPAKPSMTGSQRGLRQQPPLFSGSLRRPTISNQYCSQSRSEKCHQEPQDFVGRYRPIPPSSIPVATEPSQLRGNSLAARGFQRNRLGAALPASTPAQGSSRGQENVTNYIPEATKEAPRNIMPRMAMPGPSGTTCTSGDLLELMGFEEPSSVDENKSNLSNADPPSRCTEEEVVDSPIKPSKMDFKNARSIPAPVRGAFKKPRSNGTPSPTPLAKPRPVSNNSQSNDSTASRINKGQSSGPTCFPQDLLPEGTLRLNLRFRQTGPWDTNRKIFHQLPSAHASSAEHMHNFQSTSIAIMTEEIQASLDDFFEFLSRTGPQRTQARYDEKCTLYRTQPKSAQMQRKFKKKGNKSRGGYSKRGDYDNTAEAEVLEDDEDDSDEDGGPVDEVKKPRIFLNSARLRENHNARKACRYGDLWFVSRNPFFYGNGEKEIEVWIFQSVWHGPTAEGVLEVVPISENFDPRRVSSNWQHKTRAYALFGPNLDHKVAMARVLTEMGPHSLPIYPSLVLPQARLQPAKGMFPGDSRAKEISECLFEQTVKDFQLNEDQTQVLRQTQKWLTAEQADPVVLVHGAYGSGKTQLSVATIMYLTKVLDTLGDQSFRICVAAATNVAVDNVLKALKRRGFLAFSRVGSIRNMDQELLEHILHYNERGLAAAVQEARTQLSEMMNSDTGSSARLSVDQSTTSQSRRQATQAIRKALRHLEHTALPKLAKEQQERESSFRVVGVTCCSASRNYLMQTFEKPGVRTICLLDEAAQAVEALTMLPLVRSHAEFAMMVGDPLQLPPVTATRGGNSKLLQNNTVYADGATSLFERLSRLGRDPVRLTVQYRCHPSISDISSKLFYESGVRTGITAGDRQALVAGLPAAGFYDVAQTHEMRTDNGSFVNDREQTLVCMMVLKLVEAGIRPEQIGAIALYRAQALAIEKRLDESGRAHGVAVSTVDAFQGAERDIIIISTCRTTGPGFTACPRRVNVMITRARHHLMILGQHSALSGSKLWRDVLKECETNVPLEAVLERLADAAQEAMYEPDEDEENEAAAFL